MPASLGTSHVVSRTVLAAGRKSAARRDRLLRTQVAAPEVVRSAAAGSTRVRPGLVPLHPRSSAADVLTHGASSGSGGGRGAIQRLGDSAGSEPVEQPQQAAAAPVPCGGDAARLSASGRASETDDLIARLEERILIQLERRGGRYQGAF